MVGTDVLIKDRHRNSDGGATVGNINDASNTALARAARQQEVDLFLGIPKFSEVFNAVQYCTLVGDGGVQEMLFAVLVHTLTLKRDN